MVVSNTHTAHNVQLPKKSCLAVQFAMQMDQGDHKHKDNPAGSLLEFYILITATVILMWVPNL